MYVANCCVHTMELSLFWIYQVTHGLVAHSHSVVHVHMQARFHMMVAPLMYMMVCLLVEHLVVHGMIHLWVDGMEQDMVANQLHWMV